MSDFGVDIETGSGTGGDGIDPRILGNATVENPVLAQTDPFVAVSVLSLGAETVAATEDVSGASLTGGAATVSDSETGNTIEIHPNDGITANADNIPLTLITGLSQMSWDNTDKVLSFQGRIVIDTGQIGQIGNIALGLDALASVEDGASNVAIGVGALTSLTDGESNVALGEGALSLETTGLENVAVGWESLENQIGVSGNVGVGAYTLMRNGSGTGLVSIGYKAGMYQTGNNSVFLGYQAGLGVDGSSTAPETVAVGYRALASLTTATVCTAVGYNALSSLAVGYYNTALGHSAGSAQQAEFGTFVGAGAGASVNAGSVVCIGAQAGGNSGQESVVIGRAAGSNGGQQSVAIGTSAQGYSGNVHLSVAIGYFAGYYTGGTTHAVQIGAYAGYACNTAANGVYIGYNSGRYGYGNNNILIGHEAGTGVDGQSTGPDNVAIGYEALKVFTTASKNCVGGHQTMNALTTGSENVAWGYQAGIKATGDSDGNIFLGYMAGPSSAAEKDNALYIHNAEGAPTIYGDLANKYVGFGGIENPASAIDNAGATTMRAMAAPANPSSDRCVLYATASGETPSREVALYAKFEDGTAVKLASVLV